MEARSSDGPAGMVFDAVFNTPDVNTNSPDVGAAAPAAPVEPPVPPVEPSKEEVSLTIEQPPQRIGQISCSRTFQKWT